MLDKSKTPLERFELFRKACDEHQELYRDAMCGQGVNRHLYALYVIKRYPEKESPFFDNVFSGAHLHYTSQTPMNQCKADAKGLSDEVRLRLITAGAGFGPVADREHEEFYTEEDKNTLSFHINSKIIFYSIFEAILLIKI